MRSFRALYGRIRSKPLGALVAASAAVALGAPVSAAPVTWLEDDRHLSAEASVEVMFDQDTASPPSDFATWDEFVLAQPDELDPFSGSAAAQQSAFASRGVTADGGAGLLPGESLFWDGNAESRMRVTFELDTPMYFEFEGVLSAFSEGATAQASATLRHEQSDALLIDELVEDDEVAFSLSGSMPAGTYEYELLAFVDTLPLTGPEPLQLSGNEGSVEEMPFTAGARFDGASLVVIPAPGAFSAGVALLGAMLLRRSRQGASLIARSSQAHKPSAAGCPNRL